MMESSESLLLKNQICFPLYALSKEIIGMYRPLLQDLGITYPQYLVLMVLWENDGATVNQIGEKLFLDSGTLTPLLKRLEAKGILKRQRKIEDERVVQIFLSEEGKVMQNAACDIPKQLINKLDIDIQDLKDLKNSVSKVLNKIEKNK